MIIEIRQAGFINKGAELMLNAVVDRVRSRYPEAVITMAPMYGGDDKTYEKMASLNLYPKAWIWRKGYNFGNLFKLLPKTIRNAHGLVLDEEVDVVLDAAGFAYSDQWSVGLNRELAISSRRWKNNNTALILLPQALGPFVKPSMKEYAKKWLENADLVFAREKISYENLRKLDNNSKKIKLAPDFTNLISGRLPKGYEVLRKKVAIVPNYRMIDKTSKEESEAYLPFLIKCAEHLIKNDKTPFVLVHEGENDQRLAECLSDSVGGLEILKETDPLSIKGILGSCEATIGSRFHGLVSALSQGVPSLATGWSHKYQQLFDDYDYSEGLISVLASDEEIRGKIDMLIDAEKAQSVRTILNKRSTVLKQKSVEMWEMVFEIIDSKVSVKKLK